MLKTRLILKKQPLLIIAGLLILSFLTAAPGLAGGPPDQPPTPTPPAFVPGEILVKFQPHVTLSGAQQSLRAEGLRPLEASPGDGLIRVQVPPGQESETIAELMARGDVELAAFNRILYATVEPDDSFYSNQWALPKIQAPPAWDISTGHNSVVVAVIDSGLDTSHTEFSGRIVYPRDEIDDDTSPQDSCGHGTHVAGIIGAKGNNGTGVAGVAWDVNILPVRVLSYNGGQCSGTELDIHNGIDWAVSRGAKIINLSLGALPWPGHTCEQDFPIMSQAIREAHEAGVLVVAASGNNYTNRLACPALQAETMAVGSTTSADLRSSFSNYGPELNVVAPGSSVYSTVPPGGYSWMSGTSMAAPHVAGLAGLIWSVSPVLTRDQMTDLIHITADDLGPAGWDQAYGYGRINAWRALDAVSLQASPAVQTLFIDDQIDQVTGQIEITTVNPGTVSWSAVISPTVSWLALPPPTAGMVSASSDPAHVTLAATRPPAHGTYTATVVVTGTTSSGASIGARTSQVQLIYKPEIYRYHFPLIFKD